jgi:uncharacterized membrane protein YgdD (TMEM256/DUF423 family)
MPFLALGAVFAFLSVALGAFGAHALRDKLSSYLLSVYEKGVLYQMYHALGLLAVGMLEHLTTGHAWLLSAAGWIFTIGILLFSGSLYILSLSGKRAFGAITPVGGVCFLAGWALIFFSVM